MNNPNVSNRFAVKAKVVALLIMLSGALFYSLGVPPETLTTRPNESRVTDERPPAHFVTPSENQPIVEINGKVRLAQTQEK